MKARTVDNLVTFGFDFIVGIIELLAVTWAIMLLAGNLHPIFSMIPAISYMETMSLLAWPFIVFASARGVAKGFYESKNF